MKELLNAQFKAAFRHELFHFEGYIFMALAIYWFFSSWDLIKAKLNESLQSAIYVYFCMAFGLFAAVSFYQSWGNELFLVAFSLGIALTLALLDSTVAVSFQICLLFMRPWEMMKPPNDYFMLLSKMAFAICVGHVVYTIASRKKFSLQWNDSTTVLVIFAVWAFMTTFLSVDPASAQEGFSEGLYKSVFLYMMVMNILKEKSEIRVVITTLAMTFLAVGLISVYQTVELERLNTTMDPVRLLGIGAFSNSNDIAALMVWVFPFSLFRLFDKRATVFVKLFSILSMIVVLVSIYLSQSRGAMLGLAVAVGLFGVLKLKSKKLTILFVVCALAMIPLMIAKSGRDSSDLSQSSSSRTTYIKTGIMMGLKNPVFGVGYDSYQPNFETYATEILYEWGHRTAHNSWILAFAELGFPGLIMFIMMFVMNMKMAYRSFDFAPEFLISLVGYFVCISFLSHTYVIYPYLLYGLIGAAGRLHSQDSELKAVPA